MKVEFTEPALQDLRDIYAYVSLDDPAAASRIVTRLVERARSLAGYPYLGHATDQADTRVILVPRFRYRIFYSISANKVHVLHIRHTSRASWRPKL